MNIKKLKPTDAEDYKTIRLEALQAHPEDFADCYDEVSDRKFSEHVQTLEKQVVFGAYDDDKIVGMVGVRPYKDDRRAHTAYVWGVYVNDAYKGQGIATDMMYKAMDYVSERKFEKVILKYFTTTDIVSDFYDSLGFKQYGVDKKALKYNGVYYDECLMVKFLD